VSEVEEAESMDVDRANPDDASDLLESWANIVANLTDMDTERLTREAHDLEDADVLRKGIDTSAVNLIDARAATLKQSSATRRGTFKGDLKDLVHAPRRLEELRRVVQTGDQGVYNLLEQGEGTLMFRDAKLFVAEINEIQGAFSITEGDLNSKQRTREFRQQCPVFIPNKDSDNEFVRCPFQVKIAKRDAIRDGFHRKHKQKTVFPSGYTSSASSIGGDETTDDPQLVGQSRPPIARKRSGRVGAGGDDAADGELTSVDCVQIEGIDCVIRATHVVHECRGFIPRREGKYGVDSANQRFMWRRTAYDQPQLQAILRPLVNRGTLKLGDRNALYVATNELSHYVSCSGQYTEDVKSIAKSVNHDLKKEFGIEEKMSVRFAQVSQRVLPRMASASTRVGARTGTRFDQPPLSLCRPTRSP